jgi:hypothetical protein
MFRRAFIAAGAAIALLAAAADFGPVQAQTAIPFGSAPSPRGLQRPSPQDDAQRARRAGQIRPFGEIQAVVQSQLGARVVGVDLREEPGRRFIYHVKAVDRYGRLLAVAVDANTARILSVRGGGG